MQKGHLWDDTGENTGTINRIELTFSQQTGETADRIGLELDIVKGYIFNTIPTRFWIRTELRIDIEGGQFKTMLRRCVIGENYPHDR